MPPHHTVCLFIPFVLLASCTDSPVAVAYDGPSYTTMVPETPTGLITTVVSAARVDLSWTDESLSERRFRIQRRMKTDVWGAWAVLGALPENTTAYSDTDVVPNSVYAYRVRSCNVAGCSAWLTSKPVITEVVPARPNALTIRFVGATVSDVSFTDMSDNETHFTLMRRWRSDGEDWWNGWATVATLPPNTTTYRDSNTSPMATYHYRVRACNRAGCSDWLR